MSKSYKVAVVVGSLRKASVNRKAAEAVTRLAPDNLAFEFVEIGDLPLYDEDVEAAQFVMAALDHRRFLPPMRSCS